LAEKKRDASVSTDAPIADAAADAGDRARAPSADVFDAPRDSDADVGAPEPPEPPGRWSLTWTNGLADAPAARFCLVPVVGGQEMRARAVFLGAAALPFGRSAVLAELESIDLATADIHPYAVVGGGARSADGAFDCAASLESSDGAIADDGGATGAVVPLPAIPARTLLEGRSYLAVATGCALPWPYAESDGGRDAGDGGEGDANGGDAPTDGSGASDATNDVFFRPPPRAAVCGTTGTSAGLVLVRMSTRIAGPRFGFQVVHASVAVAGARVSLDRPVTSAPIFVAEAGPFQIVPRDGLLAVSREEFGDTVGSAQVSVGSTAGAFATSSILFSAALAASDIDETSLALGDRLTLVVVGAEPGHAAGPAWNAARVAVVRNAPFAGRD
jgi:hypothetical protein